MLARKDLGTALLLLLVQRLVSCAQLAGMSTYQSRFLSCECCPWPLEYWPSLIYMHHATCTAAFLFLIPKQMEWLPQTICAPYCKQTAHALWLWSTPSWRQQSTTFRQFSLSTTLVRQAQVATAPLDLTSVVMMDHINIGIPAHTLAWLSPGVDVCSGELLACCRTQP